MFRLELELTLEILQSHNRSQRRSFYHFFVIHANEQIVGKKKKKSLHQAINPLSCSLFAIQCATRIRKDSDVEHIVNIITLMGEYYKYIW